MQGWPGRVVLFQYIDEGDLIKFDIVTNYRDDPVKFRQDLFNIARTTLSSKILTQYKDYFSNLAVDAVLRLKVSLLTPTIILAETAEHRWLCAYVSRNVLHPSVDACELNSACRRRLNTAAIFSYCFVYNVCKIIAFVNFQKITGIFFSM